MNSAYACVSGLIDPWLEPRFSWGGFGVAAGRRTRGSVFRYGLSAITHQAARDLLDGRRHVQCCTDFAYSAIGRDGACCRTPRGSAPGYARPATTLSRKRRACRSAVATSGSCFRSAALSARRRCGAGRSAPGAGISSVDLFEGGAYSIEHGRVPRGAPRAQRCNRRGRAPGVPADIASSAVGGLPAAGYLPGIQAHRRLRIAIQASSSKARTSIAPGLRRRHLRTGVRNPECSFCENRFG